MSLKFSHEPVAWIGAIIGILFIVKDILTGEPLSEIIAEPAIVAIGAVIVRQNVKPTSKDE